MKFIKDVKRGETIPSDAKFISSRLFTKIEDYDDGCPTQMGPATRIVEEYWIDTYEIEIGGE